MLIANRDEFYDRPSKAAGYWADHPNIFGGRDLLMGGTWLATSDNGRFAALTNYRDPKLPRGSRSRGHLPVEFINAGQSPLSFVNELSKSSESYSGFNLIAGEIGVTSSELAYYSNVTNDSKPIVPGLYGLSNHLLNTPWPKVIRGKEALHIEIGKPELTTKSLFEILQDNFMAPDDDLPDTGIGLDRERLLSSIFIKTEIYGTRASTVFLIDNEGNITFEERTIR